MSCLASSLPQLSCRRHQEQSTGMCSWGPQPQKRNQKTHFQQQNKASHLLLYCHHSNIPTVWNLNFSFSFFFLRQAALSVSWFFPLNNSIKFQFRLLYQLLSAVRDMYSIVPYLVLPCSFFSCKITSRSGNMLIDTLKKPASHLFAILRKRSLTIQPFNPCVLAAAWNNTTREQCWAVQVLKHGHTRSPSLIDAPPPSIMQSWRQFFITECSMLTRSMSVLATCLGAAS